MRYSRQEVYVVVLIFVCAFRRGIRRLPSNYRRLALGRRYYLECMQDIIRIISG